MNFIDGQVIVTYPDASPDGADDGSSEADSTVDDAPDGDAHPAADGSAVDGAETAEAGD